MLDCNGELNMNKRTLNMNGIFYFNNMSRDAYGIKPIDLNLRQGARRFEQCHGSFI